MSGLIQVNWSVFEVLVFVYFCMSYVCQVLVSHVESVCCYWGRILNHSHEDGAFTQSVQSQYVALNLELNQWFSKASNRKIVQSLKTGMRYAVRLPGGIFYR